jgi:glyoxylase-like metal-dependent hydrolase (beta-lactamase superfamily II)
VEIPSRQRYQYILLQTGTLPLTPDGVYTPTVEHRCTAMLLWPAHEPLSAYNTILVDPCFTARGYADAEAHLAELQMSFNEIGWVFSTHPHRDHMFNLTYFVEHVHYQKFQADVAPVFAGITLTAYPGHAPTQQGLLFQSAKHQCTCVVGDAVLNLEWLRAWKYYWPNFYRAPEIIETWHSVAAILAVADVIIPGHGEPIYVTATLLQELLQSFTSAEYARDCQETVLPLLQQRLTQFKAES